VDLSQKHWLEVSSHHGKENVETCGNMTTQGFVMSWSCVFGLVLFFFLTSYNNDGSDIMKVKKSTLHSFGDLKFLGGGFKCFICSPLNLGKMIPF